MGFVIEFSSKHILFGLYNGFILFEKSAARRCFENVETDRLLLRRLKKEDLGAVYRLNSDPRTNIYNPYGPMKNISSVSKRLDIWLKDWKKNGFGYWSMTIKDDSRIDGVGGIKKLVFSQRYVLNLYYRLSPEIWGLGYATEMSLKAVELATKCLPEYPVVVMARKENLPSMRVAEKAGLKHNESLDTDEYTIYVTNW